MDQFTKDMLLIELENRLRFESLLTEISARFVNLPAEEIDGVINISLRNIAETLDLDRVTLGEVTPDGKDGFVTHCYNKP